MPHLKKDFKFHKLLDNKYSQQTLLAYLWRGKEKFVRNQYMPYFIVFTFDFVIRVNNLICRRGSIENNINEIEELYNKDINANNTAMYFYRSSSIDSMYERIFDYNESNSFTNEYEIYFFKILGELKNWKYNFKNNYENFKDYIYNLINYFDDNHFTWLVGENIIYSYSTWDNIEKKVYCAVLGDKKYQMFKEIYSNMVRVNKKDIDNLVEQITSLFIAIADVKNDLSLRRYTDGIDNLEQYLSNNKDMLKCKDIYYAKLYEDMENILYMLNHKGISKAKKIIDEIILFENNKYGKEMLLFEKVAITDDSFDSSQYIEL